MYHSVLVTALLNRPQMEKKKESNCSVIKGIIAIFQTRKNMPLHIMLNSDNSRGCGPFIGFLVSCKEIGLVMLMPRKLQQSRLQWNGNGLRPTHLFPQVRRNYLLRRLVFPTDLQCESIRLLFYKQLCTQTVATTVPSLRHFLQVTEN